MTISLIAVCLFCWSQKPKNENESNGYENDSVGRRAMRGLSSLLLIWSKEGMQMEDKVVQDMIERLVRIETKLDNYESLREKADSAKDLADKAYSVALNNAENIKEMKNNNKWAWGYMIGLGITIIGYFLTKL